MPLSKLPKKEKEELILRFCQALVQIKNPDEAAKFVVDLLSKSEAEKLAIRLKIAEMLLKDESYEEISAQLKVSKGTIARVAEWLRIAGDGYRLIVKRIGGISEIKPKRPTWTGIKKAYPQYYWPEKLLEEIIYALNKKQRQRVESALNSLDTKTQLYKTLSKLIK